MLGASAALAAAAYATAFAPLVALLLLMAAFGASANTATARAVTSWFPRDERGFALGIRQTAVPIGGFAAALGIPPIADPWGPRAALLVIAGAVLGAAIVAATLMVEGPIRTVDDETDALRHPVRDRRIWRLSFGSSLLIFTQVVLTGFVVLFLESERGFSHAEAGAVLAAINVVAVAGRLAAGRLSDRRDARVGLIRWIAVGTAVSVGIAAALVGARTGSLPGARGRRRAVDELERPRGSGHGRDRRPGPPGAALGLQQTMLHRRSSSRRSSSPRSSLRRRGARASRSPRSSRCSPSCCNGSGAER